MVHGSDPRIVDQDIQLIIFFTDLAKRLPDLDLIRNIQTKMLMIRILQVRITATAPNYPAVFSNVIFDQMSADTLTRPGD